jgi:hypothetical protein
MIALPSEGAATAFAINRAGQVAGWVLDSEGTRQATFWPDLLTVSLLEGPSGKSSEAFSRNDQGFIVGTVEGSAFAWSGHEAVDLHQIVPKDSPWRFFRAIAINESECIVAEGALAREYDVIVWPPTGGSVQRRICSGFKMRILPTRYFPFTLMLASCRSPM